MSKKVAIHTLGCKANQADATYLEGMLRQKGYEIVGRHDDAEFYILNTCTVTDEADREARQLTRRAKRRNPNVKVIVTGCYAETQADAVAALPSVDAVVGNGEKENIADLLPTIRCHPERPSGAKDPVASLDSTRFFARRRRTQNDMPLFGMSHYSKNTRAQVKIQDGCDKFCSFCIIPFARGKNRSVSPKAVLDELHKLQAHGFEEAVLTGIHIGTYGFDCGFSLEQLLQLINLEKPLPRIRLSSLDPEEVTERLIDVIADSEVICPHFHIAVQSGDNAILDRMKRRYRVERFYWAIGKITQRIPDVAIGTDVIVGFPGETEEQFERTYRMIEELPISYIHVFPYSKRKGTRAAHYEGHLDPAVKKDRARRLNALNQRKKQQYYKRFKNHTLEVVVEAKRDLKEGLLKGITPNYIPVHFVGNDNYFRQRKPVAITSIAGTRVYGHVAA